MLLSACLGRPVLRAGTSIGTLADVGVVASPRAPVVTGIVVRRHGAPDAWVPWEDIERLDRHGAVVAARARPESVAASVRLARDVLDAQIVDLAGHRVVRVGDVDLEAADGRLHVVSVEVGLDSVLRRLGLRRVAARLARRQIAWNDLHLPSHPGATLTLTHAVPALRRLTPHQRARLAARLPAHAALDGARRLPHRFPTHIARRRATR